MFEDAYLTCVYYFSLPEFPQNCTIVRDNSLFVRDILVSNPYNRHIELNGQYDPHYEHDFAPQFKTCWERTRRRIMSIKNDNQYDEVYLLFRTSKMALSNTHTQYATGYYNVDLDKVDIDPNYEEPVIFAKEARFVDLKSAIKLSDFLKESRNRRFSFSSETKNGFYRKDLEDWVARIGEAQNRLDDYINATRTLERFFRYYEYEDGMYTVCNDCVEIDNCPLIRRINRKGKVYHQLPEEIARRIDSYYKGTIEVGRMYKPSSDFVRVSKEDTSSSM